MIKNNGVAKNIVTNTHQHDAYKITNSERRDIIRHLLQSQPHKGQLHIPKDEYFTGTEGLQQFAKEILVWLGHPRLKVSVELSADIEGWHVQIFHDSSLISLNTAAVTQQPFLIQHSISQACLALIIKKYAHLRHAGTFKQELIEYMSIAAGLGLYTLNALHENPAGLLPVVAQHKPTVPALQALSKDTYETQFLRYLDDNKTPRSVYEPVLLPTALQSLHIPNGRLHRADFIANKVQTEKTEKERLILFSGTIALACLLTIAAWPYIPKPLSDYQRALQRDIASFHKQYGACQLELQELNAIVAQTDILSARSLNTKAQTCQQHRQNYDHALREFNRSM